MSDDDMGQEFPGAPQQVDFWSLEIPPNKTVLAKVSLMPGLMEFAHVTGVALGEKPAPGLHVVKIIPLELDGTKKPEVALGTLESGRTDQFSLDFGFSSTMGFRHTGKSTVFLSGYMTRSFGDLEDMSEDDEDYESEEESEEESESDDEEPPQAVALQNGPPKKIAVKGLSSAAAPAAIGNGAAAAGGSSSSEEDEDEEEEGEGGSEVTGEDESEEGDEDMQGDKYDRLLGAKSFGAAAAGDGGGGSSSSSEEDGEEDDSEDGDPLDIDSEDLVAGVEYADVEAMEADGESSGDEDESSDEGEDDEDEDESSDDEQQQPQRPAPAAAGKAAKRGAQPLTPPAQQPGKKQKGQEGKPVPASAPAKGPAAKTGAAAAAAGGDAAAAYSAGLVAELKQNGGSMPLSTLASKVKKPDGVAGKFKAFLVQHADTFNVSNDTVSLKK